eukprot:1144769-Amphidinium_carterae.1
MGVGGREFSWKEASYNALTGPFLSGVNYINSTYPHLRECLLLDNMLSGTIPDILAHSRRQEPVKPPKLTRRAKVFPCLQVIVSLLQVERETSYFK